MKDEFATDMAALGDDDRVRAILERVCEITGMGFAAVARVTEERWIACQVLDKIEFGLDAGSELEIKTTICDEIREYRETIVIDHVAEDSAWRTHHTPMLYGFESYVSIPIILRDGSFFGTLCAIDPLPRLLSPRETVAALANCAAEVTAILNDKGCDAHQLPGLV